MMHTDPTLYAKSWKVYLLKFILIYIDLRQSMSIYVRR
jgi:hypothetical protein